MYQTLSQEKRKQQHATFDQQKIFYPTNIYM